MTAWPVDDDDRDPVLDACLAELLGGATPPDLSSRIMAAWQVRQAQITGGTSGTAPKGNAEGDTPVSPSAANSSLGSSTGGGHRGLSKTTEGVGAADPSSRPSIRVSAPVPRSVANAAPRGSQGAQRSKSNGARSEFWFALTTIAAAIVVGVGLGLATLSWFGPVRLFPKRSEIAKDKALPDPAVDGSSGPLESSGTPQLAQNGTGDQDGALTPRGTVAQPPDSTGQLVVSGVDVLPPAIDRVEPMDQLTLVSAANRSLEDLWRREGAVPAPAVADAEWIQRVFQYVLGRLPERQELQDFLADPSSDRRERWVERLHTESKYLDEYARFWAEFWTTTWLGAAERGNIAASREGFRRYLTETITQERSFRQLAYELLASSGWGDPSAADYQGAANFLLNYHRPDAIPATSAVSRLLLGRRLDCAQCHDHPFHAEWTQQNFWELNTFFRQVHLDRPTLDGLARLVDRDADDDQVFFEESNGYQRSAEPILPNGVAIPISRRVADVRRREVLGRWVADSREFPEAVVNRVWAHFFGYGIVHPVDDMGPHNPPTDPELLQSLVEQFVSHGYRLQSLTQWLVLSDAFQRSSMLLERSVADVPERGEAPLFSRFYLRPSSTVPTWESLVQLAQWRSAPNGAGDQARTYMAGRLARLLDQNLADRAGTVGSEASPGEARILPEGKLMLSPGINRTEGIVFQQIIGSEMSDDEKIEHIFLAVVARPPEAREQELARKMLAESTHPETVLQDIWWTLLNSQEFLPNQ